MKHGSKQAYDKMVPTEDARYKTRKMQESRQEVRKSMVADCKHAC